MTHAEALDKVAKLMRLSKSDNANEAALAVSRAQEIMDRFKLTGADLLTADNSPKSQEPINHFASDPLDPKTDRWRGQLGVVVCEVNDCKLYHSGSNGFVIIGRASDAMTVRYIYGFAVREIERLANLQCAGSGRTYWNNFRLGAVEAVAKTLRTHKAETVAKVKAEAAELENGSGERALMVISNSLALSEATKREVDLYGKVKLNLRSRSAGRTTYNPNAREAGRRAGATIRFGASGSLGAGQRALA